SLDGGAARIPMQHVTGHRRAAPRVWSRGVFAEKAASTSVRGETASAEWPLVPASLSMAGSRSVVVEGHDRGDEGFGVSGRRSRFRGMSVRYYVALDGRLSLCSRGMIAETAASPGR